MSPEALEGVGAGERWTQVTASLDPARFTVATIERRLAREDPWAEYWKIRQRPTEFAIAAISGV